MQLFRPVGLEELVLVFRSAMRWFPPRLPEQPIFYPVLTREYAVQIARDWNTQSGSGAGYVLEFEVQDECAKKYPVKRVGAVEHTELWVPAEELKEFNHHIVSPIVMIDAFFSVHFAGITPEHGEFAGCDAREQLRVLEQKLAAGADITDVLVQNAEIVFAHYKFWESIAVSLGGASNSARVVQLINESGVFVDSALKNK